MSLLRRALLLHLLLHALLLLLLLLHLLLRLLLLGCHHARLLLAIYGHMGYLALGTNIRKVCSVLLRPLRLLLCAILETLLH